MASVRAQAGGVDAAAGTAARGGGNRLSACGLSWAVSGSRTKTLSRGFAKK